MVVEVKRKSDRMMSVKIEIEGVMVNVISAYALQMGCELEEKEDFWSDLDEMVDSVHKGERVLIESRSKWACWWGKQRR